MTDNADWANGAKAIREAHRYCTFKEHGGHDFADCPMWREYVARSGTPLWAEDALTDAIEAQNLYHGRNGTTPAGRTTARSILSCLRNHHGVRMAPGRPDEFQCGQCGDWLLAEDLEGHCASEGRVFAALRDRS